MLWVEKYKPNKTEEIFGQDKSISQLREFVKGYKKGSVLLYGPPGSGKTCTIYVLAKELNLEVLELNSSDFRNKERIESIIGTSSKQKSLFKKGKIILIDELDAVSGRKDRGCLQAITKVIQDSEFPIILTANNPYDPKLSSLRKKSKLIEFLPLDYTSVFNVLKKICNNEGVKYKDNILKDLARRCGGDIRAAVNDLQMICGAKKVIEDLEGLGNREQKESMLNALKIVFKSKKIENVLGIFDKTDQDLDECMLWLDENLPKEYSGIDLVQAYNCLSKADVFKGRIRRWQHWRFLVYVSSLLSAGISTAKKERNPQFVSYKPTTRIFKLWHAKMKNARRNSIAEKIAVKTHTSTRRVIQDALPYLRFVFQKGKGEDIIRELDLTEDEVDFLRS